MQITKAMIDAALDAFYGVHLRQPNGEWHANDCARMSTALYAAISGHSGEYPAEGKS